MKNSRDFPPIPGQPLPAVLLPENRGIEASPLEQPATDPAPTSRLRWVMIGFAFLATLINYLDRQALSVIAPQLTEQFQMSDETYGLILSAFMLAYTIMNGVSGPLLDRLGTRLGYALCMAWWSTAGVLHALARGPVTLGAFRFLLGMGEAGNWPAAIKVVAEWFPKHERALASGIFNCGAALGAMAAPPFVAWLVLHLGWPSAFIVTGVLGYFWLIGWWLLYYTPLHVREEATARPATPWRLLKTRFLLSLTISKIFLDPVWYFYIFWFPKYLSSVHGFNLLQIGMTAWIPFVSADVGNIVGGWLTGRMIRRGWPLSFARKASVTCSALMMTAAVPAALYDQRRPGHRPDLGGDLRLHQLQRQLARVSRGRVSEEHGGLDLGAGQHGIGLWGDALQLAERPDHR